MATNYAFATLLTSDAYLPGALALAAALNDIHYSSPRPSDLPFQTVCLVTPETVDVSSIKLLRKAFNLVVGVEVIQQLDSKGLQLLGRPDLYTVLTKLHIFRLTQFSKIIFLDADVLPVRPLSHLFTLPHEFSAVPDVGWPDVFNSGVLVFSPGEDKFNQLMDLLKSKGSWDGGDQGILNEWRGQNWNRLSFIYNTTPTAAYTYAPAYEHFGSQISAIHFIGPNKPWHALSYRPPFIKSSEAAPEQAYDYNSLLDRWFGVYDKHYRSRPITADTSFEVQKYLSAWEGQPSNPKVTVVAEPPSTSVLSLEELRRIAIEGLHSVSSLTTHHQQNDGDYVRLPLEGRVDLMRPRQPQGSVLIEEVDADKKAPEDDGNRRATGPEDTTGTSLWNTGLEGTNFRGVSIAPPSPEGAAFELHVQGDVPSTPLRKPLDGGLPIVWESQPTPSPHALPPSPRPKPISLPTTPTPHAWAANPPYTPLKVPPPILEQESTLHGSPKEEVRPPSPPLLLWNPAVEPPPTTIPISSFPLDTYYPNAWDQTSTRQPDDGSHPQGHTQLFHPPPTPEIPKPLVREGHYREVTGEATKGTAPAPDPTKIKHIFPWEDQPRNLPSRVFPVFETQSPTATPTKPPTRGHPATLGPQTPLSPLRGLPVNLAYANTWDTIPSIQKYASRLRPPKLPAVTLAPAFDDNEWKRLRDRGDKAEISSRDGDDEDSEGESAADDSDQDKTSRRSSRRSSIVSATELITGKKKQYKTRGVQTIPRDMRTRGVQVNTFLVDPSSSSKAKTRPESPPPDDVSLQPDLPMSTAMPSPVSEPHCPLPPFLASEQRSPALSPTITLQVPSFTRPLIHVPALRSPSIISRQISNDSSLGSPASSGPPMSPADIYANQSPVRKGGRVWDPARGVDVFKRGSDQVLARFLKMGSWEDEAARPR